MADQKPPQNNKAKHEAELKAKFEAELKAKFEADFDAKLKAALTKAEEEKDLLTKQAEAVKAKAEKQVETDKLVKELEALKRDKTALQEAIKSQGKTVKDKPKEIFQVGKTEYRMTVHQFRPNAKGPFAQADGKNGRRKSVESDYLIKISKGLDGNGQALPEGSEALIKAANEELAGLVKRKVSFVVPA